MKFASKEVKKEAVIFFTKLRLTKSFKYQIDLHFEQDYYGNVSEER